MSTNPNTERSRESHDPTKDEYLELEQKLGAAEQALADDVAATNKAVGDKMENARHQARSAIENIRRGPGKRHS